MRKIVRACAGKGFTEYKFSNPLSATERVFDYVMDLRSFYNRKHVKNSDVAKI